MSGGAAFFPTNSSEIDEGFERIAVQLRHQYSIGFRPTNFTADGRWHRLKIRVELPDTTRRAFIRSRRGYFSGTNFVETDDF
jgi:Ca-activated chloride channel family protein